LHADTQSALIVLDGRHPLSASVLLTHYLNILSAFSLRGRESRD